MIFYLSPLSIPGVYDRNAASAVSKSSPKFSMWFFMPCWNTELRLVLQMIRSAHWTITIDTKNAVWHVNSRILRSLYVHS